MEITWFIPFIFYFSTFRTECWGIIGYVGTDDSAEDVLLDGIQILQNRGYDSWGIVTVNEMNEYVWHKKSSKSAQGGDWIPSLLDVAEGLHRHFIGFAHTRWATHGGK